VELTATIIRFPVCSMMLRAEADENEDNIMGCIFCSLDEKIFRFAPS